MTSGDIVEAIHMPHLGLGVIEFVAPDGRLVVSFEVDGRPYQDTFDPHEVERARPLVTRAA